jgi:hypothetical protein
MRKQNESSEMNSKRILNFKEGTTKTANFYTGHYLDQYYNVLTFCDENIFGVLDKNYSQTWPGTGHFCSLKPGFVISGLICVL